MVKKGLLTSNNIIDFEKAPIRSYNTISIAPLLVAYYSVGDVDAPECVSIRDTIDPTIASKQTLLDRVLLPFTGTLLWGPPA